MAVSIGVTVLSGFWNSSACDQFLSFITAESGNTFYIKVVEIFASFSESYGMQSDDHQTGRYDRFTALLFVHLARNFQIVYITFVLVTYHLFVNLLIILKRHMDHG